MQDNQDNLQPVTYVSRVLPVAKKKNYSVIQRHCSSLGPETIQRFHLFVSSNFTERPSSYDRNVHYRHLQDKFARWFLAVQEFNPVHEYAEGYLPMHSVGMLLCLVNAQLFTLTK